MKNHRFPWLRNRTTDNRKCEKARNIKEKRTIEMFNPDSRSMLKDKHRRTNASQLVLNPAVRHFSTIYFFKNFAISSTSSGCHESEFNTPLCHIENLAPASVVPQPLP